MPSHKPTAFVIMPFAETFRPGFDDIIRPAVEEAGLVCVRADQEQQGHIHTQVFERPQEFRSFGLT